MTSPAVPLFGTRFYFLRHGETEANRLATIAGSMDVELNDAGRAQARAAIERVRPLGITRVTSSDLRRARETAAILAGALGLPHVIVPELAERNWGELEGKPRDLRKRGVPPPAGESAEAFMTRVRGALAQVGADGVPLLVAHSGTHRVLCRLLGLAEPGAAVVNCCPVRFTPPARQGETWSMELI